MKQRGATWMLRQLALHKKPYKTDQQYQLWQEGNQPKQILGQAMLRQKIDYIHQNPVQRGYVEAPVHWRYSSASDYAGEPGSRTTLFIRPTYISISSNTFLYQETRRVPTSGNMAAVCKAGYCLQDINVIQKGAPLSLSPIGRVVFGRRLAHRFDGLRDRRTALPQQATCSSPVAGIRRSAPIEDGCASYPW